MSASSSADTIGFIGLGNMGRPMAANLCRKGFPVRVYDVNPVPVAALVALGARAGASVADVAQASDVVITMLPSSAIVEQVVAGVDGVLAHLRRGGLVMD